MYRIHGTYAIFLINENCHTDLRCCDHVDVYALVIKALEHFCGNTRVTHHTGSHDGKLGNIFLRMKLIIADACLVGFQNTHCIVQIIFINSKGNVLGSGTADRLKDHIHIDIFLSQGIKKLKCHSW